MFKDDSSMCSQHVEFLNSCDIENSFEVTKIFHETDKLWASKTMPKKEKNASSYNMPKDDVLKELSFSNRYFEKQSLNGVAKVIVETKELQPTHFSYPFNEATQKRDSGDQMHELKLLYETHKQQTFVKDDKISTSPISDFEKSALSHNMIEHIKRNTYKMLEFSNSQSKQSLLKTAKINVEKKESWDTDALSQFSDTFNEANQKRNSNDQINEINLSSKTHKQQTKDNKISTPPISNFDKISLSCNMSELIKRNAYKTLEFSNSQSKQSLLETTKTCVEEKESWDIDAVSHFSDAFNKANQKCDLGGRMNELSLSSESHNEENFVKDNMTIHPVQGLEKSNSSYNVMEMFEFLNSRGTQSLFGVTKICVETKKSWASNSVARFDHTFNQVNQKCDSDSQINELKSSSKIQKQEELVNDGIMSSEMYEYHPPKKSIFIYEPEHQKTENSKKRPSCEIQVHESKCIAETMKEKRSGTHENILPSYYPDVSMCRKGRLFDGFKYSTHCGNLFPLVSCVTINTPLIQEWGRRGILIKSTEISHSTKECWKENMHAYCGIKLKHLADVIQNFKGRKGIQHLSYDRDNAKGEGVKAKFQENSIPEAKLMDFLIVDLKNGIKKSEFVEKEQQLSKDIKEFQMKTEKMDEKYEKYDKIMEIAAELSQEFKARLKESKKMSEKVSNALSDPLL